MLKIILFDGTFKTTTFINRLARGLAANHEVYIVGFNEQLETKIENVHYAGLGSNQSSYLFIKRSIVLRGYNLKKQLSLFKSLIKGKKSNIKEENLQFTIDRIQPDILHFQWVSVLSYLDKIKLPNKTKTVFSQRGFHINVRPFINQENMCWLKEIFPKINGFHSVSKAIKVKSNEIYSSSSKIDHVVYSGFDFKKLPQKNKFNSSTTLQIVSVGRNHWKKDYKSAIIAMKYLKDKNIKFHYTIVGVDKEEELLFLVSDLSLVKEVSFISSVSQKDVYQLMVKSDLFLLPSVEEGIANVCIEAMFCKLPVLSTNCGGMSELIEDNETGFLVPTRSPESIANKIGDILQLNNQRINSIIVKARKKVIEQHNTLKMVADMEYLYKKIHEAD
ncbi:glycosyltransferase family 4 protein [Wenyingzhuangia sp. IMCC45533]